MTPFSDHVMADADWANLTHFDKSEFAEPSAMGLNFLHWLDGVREAAGVPFHITSSYRTHAHNVAVGGAADSAHCDLPCNAVDLMPANGEERFKIIDAALAAGCQRIGLYANGSIHLDRTEDKRPAPAIWTVVANKAK